MLPAFSDIDLTACNPIPSILASPAFQHTVQAFADSPSIKGALISPDSQALLYCLIRLFQPSVAVEIGTYLASTTEAMARAVAENGNGMLHTVDPYGEDRAPPIIAQWPQELRNVTNLHITDSMMFFAWMQQCEMRTGLVFVDGNHEYEFALFDIQCAARVISPGGFIVIDNIAQPGPFFAARDFLEKAHSLGWSECGSSLQRYRLMEPFDRHRTTIHNTDFCVLRAPNFISIGNRPVTFGSLPWTVESAALRLKLAGESAGQLHVQFIIRVFENPPREIIQSASIDLAEGTEFDITIPFPELLDKNVRKTVEPWLSWQGTDELRLRDFPSIC
jgi:predicted O-methyltransferase YrrM